ncbi:hypothetical protein, partial [Burkholderia pseudomallei]|uniref:hypothetical protein n=1 Tax=Burkholderia pseudomallei TaxID=28450 RepID=UPI001C84040D
RGHGRLQHHAIKKQKPRTWRGFVSNLNRQFSCWRFFYMRAACAGATNARKTAARILISPASARSADQSYNSRQWFFGEFA